MIAIRHAKGIHVENSNGSNRCAAANQITNIKGGSKSPTATATALACLCNAISAVAAGGGGNAAANSVAACRDRANSLGDLLDKALRAAEDRTKQAEDHAAEVRALLDA